MIFVRYADRPVARARTVHRGRGSGQVRVTGARGVVEGGDLVRLVAMPATTGSTVPAPRARRPGGDVPVPGATRGFTTSI